MLPFEALLIKENIDSPKKHFPMINPYRPPTSLSSYQASTLWAKFIYEAYSKFYHFDCNPSACSVLSYISTICYYIPKAGIVGYFEEIFFQNLPHRMGNPYVFRIQYKSWICDHQSIGSPSEYQGKIPLQWLTVTSLRRQVTISS